MLRRSRRRRSVGVGGTVVLVVALLAATAPLGLCATEIADARSAAPNISVGGAPEGAAMPTPDATGGILAPGAPAPAAGAGALQPRVAPLASTATAAALAGRAFTYQGLLRGSGVPVTGPCDLQFSFWDDPAVGTQMGTTQTVTTTVSNGLFTVVLNDAGQFSSAASDGRATWLAIAVRSPSGSGVYIALSPRQPVTAAPLASGLAPHATINAGDSYSGNQVLGITAPASTYSNPMALNVSSSTHSAYVGTFNPVGIWTDCGPGIALWATTDGGTAVAADVTGSGLAARFGGNVQLNGKLNSPLFRTQLVINVVGPLPATSAPFSTGGGTLLLAYSGSGFLSSGPGTLIGMTVQIDGSFVDNTAIFANQSGMHLAFVPKTWVLTGIAAGSHVITLFAWGSVSTDYNDIFNVTVTELPF